MHIASVLMQVKYSMYGATFAIGIKYASYVTQEEIVGHNNVILKEVRKCIIRLHCKIDDEF